MRHGIRRRVERLPCVGTRREREWLSRSTTPGVPWTPISSLAFSNASTAPIHHATATPGAPVSAWPSSSTSSRRRAGRCLPPATRRASPSGFFRLCLRLRGHHLLHPRLHLAREVRDDAELA